jgi:hypothetical protein
VRYETGALTKWQFVAVYATKVGGEDMGPGGVKRALVEEIRCFFKRRVIGCYACPKPCFVICPKDRRGRLDEVQYGYGDLDSWGTTKLFAYKVTIDLAPDWYKALVAWAGEIGVTFPELEFRIHQFYGMPKDTTEQDRAASFCDRFISGSPPPFDMTQLPMKLPNAIECGKPKES